MKNVNVSLRKLFSWFTNNICSSTRTENIEVSIRTANISNSRSEKDLASTINKILSFIKHTHKILTHLSG